MTGLCSWDTLIVTTRRRLTPASNALTELQWSARCLCVYKCVRTNVCVRMCVCACVHVSLYQAINESIYHSPFLAPWLPLSLCLSPSISILLHLPLLLSPRVCRIAVSSIQTFVFLLLSFVLSISIHLYLATSSFVAILFTPYEHTAHCSTQIPRVLPPHCG